MKHKGFTLIEILIVIIVIAILAAVILPKIKDVPTRARNSSRRAALSQISTALELYHTDNEKYPDSLIDLISGNWKVSTSLPQDPQGGIWVVWCGIGWYGYVSTTWWYVLSTKLEPVWNGNNTQLNFVGNPCSINAKPISCTQWQCEGLTAYYILYR